MIKTINLNSIKIANNLPFVLIAGPCQMESRSHALETATSLKEMTDKEGIQLIYKSSFDKANRTSINSKRGIGLDKALEVFSEIKEKLSIPIITDVHEKDQCKIVSEVVDVLQIPAFLCRQTDLLVAAAKTNSIINVKKGQFLAPWDIKNIVEKISSSGNNKILLTERGTCFGYNNLITDIRSLEIMSKTGYPVVFDATHSVQQPSAQGGSSGGQRDFISVLAKASITVGIAALFIETHPDPDNAPSDGPCMLPQKDLPKLLKTLKSIDSLIKNDSDKI